MVQDDPEPTDPKYVTYYGKVTHVDLERPPRDVDEPRLLTLIKDTGRAQSEKKTQAMYDEYLHIWCYAFFDKCTNN
jgi:hypothetical protein